MTSDREHFRRQNTRPFREFEELRRRFEQDVARPFIRAIWDQIPEQEKESWGARWVPAVDVIEKSDHILVIAEVPGMKDSIDLSVSGDMLTLKGEKKSGNGEVNEGDYFQREISRGTFYRTIKLPVNIETEKVEADYEDGILRVILPRHESTKARKIDINVKNQPE
jgi:HSP20 family protein